MLTVAELFKIGLGPSSSHTTGPMKAALRFVGHLQTSGLLAGVGRIETRLFGSLALTGLGHHTDRAILLGLSGYAPEVIEPDKVEQIIQTIDNAKQLSLANAHNIQFCTKQDIRFETQTHLPFHSNAMMFLAYDEQGQEQCRRIYYSIGGGFVVDEVEAGQNQQMEVHPNLPHQFISATSLLEIARQQQASIADIVMANECALQSPDNVNQQLDFIWQQMSACIEYGISRRGMLPGSLQVRRRAADLAQKLGDEPQSAKVRCERSDWLSLWAMAVNEENASGGKVVTAPTNGAAGVIPAVLKYYLNFVDAADQDGVRTFLLTATAIGGLYKRNASISGAEVGCQGEVGVACSMAAAGLAAVLGGSNAQIENAAEIGMEHNLGMTCDPVGGLVQIPCIERNAFGAAMAVQAARLALLGDGTHFVSLDKVIQTMRDTGRDMSRKYKETSEGGLAVNVVEC
ncbi:L-serine dehydratase, beta subunit / L-serine dehydratase, alpha subunit [hydrothermal vent metagenome]|uniref:L-serine dehydratase, beta subunit / L-serine dehydratase, alpha subunit n=1 Tax=hydrothermal vent metagenome TaxID=652676 RepID=A0A3B0RTU1_9ZZZZ